MSPDIVSAAMLPVMLRLGLLVLCVLYSPVGVLAQGFGGAGGAGNYQSRGERPFGEPAAWRPSYGTNGLTSSTGAEREFIMISGTAEVRIVPEQIRVVLAIISEGETAAACQQQTLEQIQAVRTAWTELAIPNDQIVEDFIAILPRYEWRTEQRDGENIRIQRPAGHRMQSNLHLAVGTEPAAMAAINAAFKLGVTDIVTFDYWSSDLENQLVIVRQQALEVAKKKADLLLSVFDARPLMVNVHEESGTFFPHDLYRTYENVLEEEEWDHDRSRPQIKAYRPKMTFFDGLKSQADVRPTTVAMRPEITVISTVTLVYQSPAEDDDDEDDDEEDNDD